MRYEDVIGVVRPTSVSVEQNTSQSNEVVAESRSKKRSGGRPKQNKVCSDKVLQTFNTWAFKREQPSDLDLLRCFVASAIARNEPISFVLYWGKGPRRRVAQPELECLDFLTALTNRVGGGYGEGAKITLIFTDTHARLNGHCTESARDYFGAVEELARERGFETCLLGDLTRASNIHVSTEMAQNPASDEVLRDLTACATKWYRGGDTVEAGALKYYEINMVERRAVEIAFPHSIFVTFNGSKFRCLFPDRLPIFYMYSLRRGVAVKPWFLPQIDPLAEVQFAG